MPGHRGAGEFQRRKHQRMLFPQCGGVAEFPQNHRAMHGEHEEPNLRDEPDADADKNSSHHISRSSPQIIGGDFQMSFADALG